MLKTNLKIYLDTSVISAYFDKRQYVLSWNFKHMVNISVRAAVDAANVQSGCGHIDILAPAEML